MISTSLAARRRVCARMGAALMIAGAVALPTATPTAAHDLGVVSPQRVAVNSVRFSDLAGDATAGGLDITNVTVSNDDAGTLRFVIEIPSSQTLPAQNGVGLFFDTDQNSGTGAGGSEYRVFLDPAGTPAEFDRWNASASPPAWNRVEGVLLSASYTGGAWTGSLRSSGLPVSAFNLFVEAFQQTPDGSRPTTDRAPNSGSWPYEIKIGTPTVTKKLAITSFSRKPNPPVAGESFTVSVDVERVGWPGRFNGTVHCSALPGVQARWFGSVGPGRAACRWDIPANAAGKVIRGSIAVSEQGGPLTTRKFTAKVVRRTVKLSSGEVTTGPPAGPLAGDTFYYVLDVTVRFGSAKPIPIQRGRVDCKATIGGRPIKAAKEVVRSSNVLCGWEIPAGTAGQAISGLIVVRSQGATLTHRFTRRVR